jgi:carotenoid cleavage dioxygenase-like enzyme
LRHKVLADRQVRSVGGGNTIGLASQTAEEKTTMEINTRKKFSVTVLLATTMQAVVEVFATNEHQAELQALEIASDSDVQWEFTYQDFIDGRVPDGCGGEYYRIGEVRLSGPEITADDHQGD